MIGVFATGQMGNQMFEYAFGYAASRRLNVGFFIYGAESLYYFKLYENLKKYNKLYLLLYSMNKLARKKQFGFLADCLKKRKNPIRLFLNWEIQNNSTKWPSSFDEDKFLLSNIRNNTLYEGLFQSEKYFENYKEEIKKLFEIRPEYKAPFLKNKMWLFEKKSVAVHLRRAEYATFGDEELGGADMTVPLSYYKKCLGMIDEIDDCNVIFVSDDIEFVRKEFEGKENYFFEKNNAINDFQILLHADIVITSNSSYAWWGAWLNDKKDKIVYAPKYYCGFKVDKFYPAGIKVNSWNWINVH